MAITAVILAGGQSRRMGQDKAALEFGGSTLLERIARAALDCGLPVLVVGRTRPADWPLEVKFAEDEAPGLGPLGGLAAALKQSQASVLALACDLPLLTEEALRWLMAQADVESGTNGLVAVNGDQWEPLFSIYHLSVLPAVERCLADRRRSLHGLIKSSEFAFVQTPAWVSAQLVNVNTAEEWQRVNSVNSP